MVARRPRGTPDDERRAPTLWQTWMSVLAAFFGVQSRANQERDFAHGKPSHFILLGLLATLLFILMLVGLVELISHGVIG